MGQPTAEAVADTADRLDVPARVAELLAQAFHVRVDGADRDGVGVPPDLVDELVARDALTSLRHAALDP